MCVSVCIYIHIYIYIATAKRKTSPPPISSKGLGMRELRWFPRRGAAHDRADVAFRGASEEASEDAGHVRPSEISKSSSKTLSPEAPRV